MKVNLTEDELKYIIEVIGKQPYVNVANLIQKLVQQLNQKDDNN